MPRPLRLDPHGAKVYADWKRTASSEDIDLVDEVFRRVTAGTWLGWRHSEPDVGDPNVTVISPRENLWVSVRFQTDGPETFDVEYIGPHPDNWP